MEKNEHTPTHNEIAKRAEEIWHERHEPTGSDLEIWLEAERQLAVNAQQSDYQANPAGVAERKIASEKEDSQNRLTSETAAESMVEYNISPPVPDDEAVRAAMPKQGQGTNIQEQTKSALKTKTGVPGKSKSDKGRVL